MKPPAIDRAVHTTPPMMSAAVMPSAPLSPMLASTSELMMRVMSVMPDTGLVPTMAMALAATVVKRNAMTNTIRSATTLWNPLPSRPKRKNTNEVSSAAMRTDRMSFIGRSRCVRSVVSTAADFLGESSPTASAAA